MTPGPMLTPVGGDQQSKLRFNSKGDLDFHYFYVKEGNKNMRAFTEKMLRFMDEEYRFDVTFYTEIISY